MRCTHVRTFYAVYTRQDVLCGLHTSGRSMRLTHVRTFYAAYTRQDVLCGLHTSGRSMRFTHVRTFYAAYTRQDVLCGLHTSGRSMQFTHVRTFYAAYTSGRSMRLTHVRTFYAAYTRQGRSMRLTHVRTFYAAYTRQDVLCGLHTSGRSMRLTHVRTFYVAYTRFWVYQLLSMVAYRHVTIDLNSALYCRRVTSTKEHFSVDVVYNVHSLTGKRCSSIYNSSGSQSNGVGRKVLGVFQTDWNSRYFLTHVEEQQTHTGLRFDRDVTSF
ncbi:hypothetical protein Btru_006144 [Bulinus truncatus]|nr:hypothetical protein Btru_006144 [Bulinus truncatus]